MIGHQAGDGALDLLAVQRDDELLDLLGSRGQVPADDELVRLLAAWRDDVDEGLVAPVVPRPAPVRSAPVLPVADLRPGPDPVERPHRRRLTAAGTAAAVVLGGTLSLSGVAAAVTGDPLAPYRAVGHALSIGGADLPASAARVAQLNKRLARARAALAHGDAAAVSAAIADVTAALDDPDLTDGQRHALERRLAALQAAMARTSAADAKRARSHDRATAAATPRGGSGDRTAPPAKGKGDDRSGADGQQTGKAGGAGTKDPAVDPEAGSGKPATKDQPAPAAKGQPTPSAGRPEDGGGGPSGGDQTEPADQATAGTGSAGGGKGRSTEQSGTQGAGGDGAGHDTASGGRGAARR